MMEKIYFNKYILNIYFPLRTMIPEYFLCILMEANLNFIVQYFEHLAY